MRNLKFDLELHGCGSIVVLTLLLLIGIGIYLGSLSLPLWAAIPVGIIGGLFVFGVMCLHGNSTVMEIGCQCIITLVLIAILIPVFMRARQKAQHAKLRQQQKIQQMQKTNR